MVNYPNRNTVSLSGRSERKYCPYLGPSPLPAAQVFMKGSISSY